MMKQLLLTSLVILLLISASKLTVVIYDSDSHTDHWYWDHDHKETKVLIGFNQEQWQKQLKQLDFDFHDIMNFEEEKKIPILISLGWRPTGGYDINIDRIVKEDENTIITVSLRSPKPNQYVTMAFTYPYDYLILDRYQLINEKITVVSADGIILAEFYEPFPGEEREMQEIKIYY